MLSKFTFMDHQEFITSALKELIEERKPEAVESFFATNYVAHAGDKKYEGHDFILRWNKQLHGAIEKIKVQEVKFLSQESNRITWQRKLSGVHKKSLRGIPASGKKVTWFDMVVSRFENGKIAEEWLVSELASALMLKQPKKRNIKS